MTISVIMLSLIVSHPPQLLKPTSRNEKLFVFDTSHMYFNTKFILMSSPNVTVIIFSLGI